MNCFSFEKEDEGILNAEDELIFKINKETTDHENNGDIEKLGNGIKSSPIFATESQARVIEFPSDLDTVLVVKAGPGSGKTSTIVKRIAYMISMGKLKPEEVLVLSMANRSVNSLKNYLTHTIGEELTNKININTFHSFCGGLVDQYGDQYSPSFKKKTLMDDLSWRSFSNIFLGKSIKLDGRTMDGNLSPPNLERLLIEVKSGKLTISQAAFKYKVRKEYIEALITYLDSNGMIRYHDLLTNALELIQLSLKQQANGNQKLIPQLETYKAVVVDEFQDIHPQLLLVVKAVIDYPTLQYIHAIKKHLTIAGDPNQSIYEFLGSKPELISRIHFEFPESKVTQLPINESFRITPEILHAVTEVCLKPSGLYNPDQDLKSIRKHGHKPVIKRHASNRDEYAFIASEITRLICELGGLLKPSDFAVLTRSNKEIEEVSKFLTQTYNIKCNRFSLSSTWIKSKVHVLLDILNVIIKGPGSDFGLLCVLSIMDRKIGSTSRISKLFNLSNKWKIEKGIEVRENSLEEYINQQLDFIEIEANNGHANIKRHTKSMHDITSIYKIPKYNDEISRLKTFMDSIEKVRENLIHNNQSSQNPKTILDSLLRVVTDLGLLNYLNAPELSKKHATETDLLDIEKEYRKQLRTYLQSFNKSLKYSYQSYIEQNVIGRVENLFMEYFLRNYNDEIPTVDREMINLSTVHTAKGLEFPVVFISGVQNAKLLSYWDLLLGKPFGIHPPGKARLLYVACTRARDLLYVGTSKNLDSLLPSVLDSFTINLPEMNSVVDLKSNFTLMQSISENLQRKVPTKSKISEGQRLYKELTSVGLIQKTSTNISHFRLFHTLQVKPRLYDTFIKLNGLLLKR